MSYVTAIVLAAGKGLRLKSRTSKPLIEIGSKPVIFYCLEALERHPGIKDIIVVANKDNIRRVAANTGSSRFRKLRKVVLGGRRRQDSVYNGIKAMEAKTDLVLIHDAARPFINNKIISPVIKEAEKNGAAIAGVPVKNTIKKVSRRSIAEKTINRENIWEIQTPQAFKKDIILKAYKAFGRVSVSDDAGLVEKTGIKPRVVMGSYFNIKITTPEDLVLAEAIARKWNIK